MRLGGGPRADSWQHGLSARDHRVLPSEPASADPAADLPDPRCRDVCRRATRRRELGFDHDRRHPVGRHLRPARADRLELTPTPAAPGLGPADVRTPFASRLLPRPAYPTCSRRTSYRGGWRTGDRQWAAGGGTDPGRRSRSRRSERRCGCGASGAGSPRMSSARLSSARSLLLDDWNICSPGYGALRTEGGVPAQSRW
jgi:hypothetical protein